MLSACQESTIENILRWNINRSERDVAANNLLKTVADLAGDLVGTISPGWFGKREMMGERNGRKRKRWTYLGRDWWKLFIPSRMLEGNIFFPSVLKNTSQTATNRLQSQQESCRENKRKDEKKKKGERHLSDGIGMSNRMRSFSGVAMNCFVRKKTLTSWKMNRFDNYFSGSNVQ